MNIKKTGRKIKETGSGKNEKITKPLEEKKSRQKNRKVNEILHIAME